MVHHFLGRFLLSCASAEKKITAVVSVDNAKNKTETAIINGKSQFECQCLQWGRQAERSRGLRKWRNCTTTCSYFQPYAQGTFKHIRVSDFHCAWLQGSLASCRDHTLVSGSINCCKHRFLKHIINYWSQLGKCHLFSESDYSWI